MELPPNVISQLDVGRAIGQNGAFYVVCSYLYVTILELVFNDAGNDVVHYLVTSEQIPSAFKNGLVLVSIENR
ncbi:Hsp33 family molecular chaperone HslO [cyanobacterium endosymbiont of Epithemia turgida]|uniref:Hsp33 family molecular chaperone HslO n=1 Tax=cyanobacterium endosymbiont of Epithemia turgida TaxID=718217 RepID=UPI00069825A3|nr:Hsp33 family molecular chaperone HslO [cyanobacterium endosymbiont of Epithemia turgida]